MIADDLMEKKRETRRVSSLMMGESRHIEKERFIINRQQRVPFLVFTHHGRKGREERRWRRRKKGKRRDERRKKGRGESVER